MMISRIRLGDVAIDVTFKPIKNLHLSVHPPDGAVCISAPEKMRLESIRAFAIGKLDWIRQQRAKFRAQGREPPREFIERESHYLWGRRYLMRIVEEERPARIELSHRRMVLHVRPDTGREARQAIVDRWYREQVKAQLPGCIGRWEAALGVKVRQAYVQKMKTRWGSCNPVNRTIRINSEVAKRPKEHLDYVVLHEVAHFLVPRHDDRFAAILDRCMPGWRQLRQELNAGSLVEIG